MSDDLSFYYPGSSQKGVLLIHGLTGSPAEMRYLGKQLHRRGFTVYAPMLPGHGQGLKELLATRWQDWAAGVEQAYRHLQTQVEQVYAAGICVGGSLALQLAARTPALKGVTVFSTTLQYNGWNSPRYYALAPLIPLASKIPLLRRLSFAESYPYGLKDERLRQLVQSGGTVVEGALDAFPLCALNQMYRLSNEIKRLLPGITTPTLLIHALEDDMSHPANAEYVARHIGGECRIEWLEESYHMLHVDQERRKVAEVTAEFFGCPEAPFLREAANA